MGGRGGEVSGQSKARALVSTRQLADRAHKFCTTEIKTGRRQSLRPRATPAENPPTLGTPCRRQLSEPLQPLEGQGLNETWRLWHGKAHLGQDAQQAGCDRLEVARIELAVRVDVEMFDEVAVHARPVDSDVAEVCTHLAVEQTR